MHQKVLIGLDFLNGTQNQGFNFESQQVKKDEEKILRVISRANSRPIVEVSFYDRRLATNAILDWISEMDKYFEYESTPNSKKVKVVVTKLKGRISFTNRERKERKRKYQDMGKNDWKDEEEVSPYRLPGHFVEEDAKFEAKEHEFEAIY